MPKVSVIVPVYKVEESLEKCVTSICEQTLRDIEIILVDDGSPDKCPALCEKLAEKDPRIKVIHKKNEGLGYARNTGLANATGDFIGFVDSDDYIQENMYEDLYEAAISSHADAAYGGVYYVRNNEVISKSSFIDRFTVWEGRTQIQSFLMDLIASPVECAEDANFGATVWKAIFSHKLIEDANIRFYSEREFVSEDSLFDIDFCVNAAKIVMIPENYYYYRYNPNSLTAVYRGDRFEKNKALFLFAKKKLWTGFQDVDQLIQYGRMFIAASRVCIIQEVYHSKSVGIRAALQGIRSICEDEMLQNVLEEYPWNRLPLKKKIFAFFMQKKMAFAQFLMVRLMYLQRK